MPVACWYGGTGKVEQADWTPAKGWRFILWPDDDLAGRNAMHKAASLIQRAGGEVVGIVNTSGKSGNDAADLAVGQRAAVIAGAVDYIPPEQPAIKQAEDDGAGGEFAAGVWYAQRYLTPGVDQPGWLFSWSSNAWFYWDKSVWTDPPAPEKQIRVDIAARRDELAAEAKLAGVSGKSVHQQPGPLASEHPAGFQGRPAQNAGWGTVAAARLPAQHAGRPAGFAPAQSRLDAFRPGRLASRGHRRQVHPPIRRPLPTRWSSALAPRWTTTLPKPFTEWQRLPSPAERNRSVP